MQMASFTKLHALMLASLLFTTILVVTYSSYFYPSSYTNDLKPTTNGLKPMTNDLKPTTNGLKPMTNGLKPTTNENKRFETKRISVIPFQKVPPPAKECAGKAFFYPQGVEGDKCVDKCPAPTLPDDVGHCKGGMSMA